MKTVTIGLTKFDNPDNVDLEWLVEHVPLRDATDHIGSLWQFEPWDAVMTTVIRKRDEADKLVEHVNVRVHKDLWDWLKLYNLREALRNVGAVK